MNKNYIFVLITFLAIGCTQADLEAPMVKTLAITKSDPKFKVGIGSVKYFLNMMNKTDSASKYSIDPVVYQGDTLLYVVNYENDNGWKIISGDKRTQPILASGKKGAFAWDKINSGVARWIDDLANRIYELKKTDQCDSTKTDYKMWTNIESLVSGKPMRVAATIGGSSGYWEYAGCIIEESLPALQIGPLVQTKWGQDAWWNFYAPYATPDYATLQDPTHCALGCVAVAGGQMLNFLHNKIGKPVNAYANINYSGYLKYDNVTFSGYEPWVWNYMKLDKNDQENPYKYSQVLLAYVAYKINTEFGVNESSSTVADLKSFFNNEGISCNLIDYNITTALLTNISNGMPVIATGNETCINHYFLGIFDVGNYEYKDGHAWIINGWKDRTFKITNRYIWVESGTDPIMLAKRNVTLPPLEDEYREEVSYTNNYSYIMNWGKGGDYDDGDYSLEEYYKVNGHNFQYNRKMICDFQ